MVFECFLFSNLHLSRVKTQLLKINNEVHAKDSNEFVNREFYNKQISVQLNSQLLDVYIIKQYL